jgi:hypothetical protein
MFYAEPVSMTPENDDLSPTSFSSIPKDLIEEVRKVAEAQGVTILRFVYEEAVTELCDDLDAGLKIETWPSSRPGGSKSKETVRLAVDVSERMKETVARHKVRLGVFFRVALIRWLARHGVEYQL